MSNFTNQPLQMRDRRSEFAQRNNIKDLLDLMSLFTSRQQKFDLLYHPQEAFLMSYEEKLA